MYAMWLCIVSFCFFCCFVFHFICFFLGCPHLVKEKSTQKEFVLLVRSHVFFSMPLYSPKCRHPYPRSERPTKYFCFCKKVQDPPFDPWVTPHSVRLPSSHFPSLMFFTSLFFFYFVVIFFLVRTIMRKAATSKVRSFLHLTLRMSPKFLAPLLSFSPCFSQFPPPSLLSILPQPPCLLFCLYSHLLLTTL